MIRNVRVFFIVACLVGLAGMQSVAWGATSKPPKIKTRIAKVQIDLAGYVETRQLHETTSDCYPGERWIQTNRYEFETGRFVNISMKRITGQGFDPIVTSPFTALTGSATSEGKITEYRTTNYCEGEPGRVAPEPSCARTTGRTSASMQEGPMAKGDEDLTPLTQTPLLLAIRRGGGGSSFADPECVGAQAGSISGKDTNTSVIGTSPAPGVSLVLPTGLSVMKVFNIRPGKRRRRAVMISGPCTHVTLRTAEGSGSAPPRGSLNADGDCFMTGRVVLTIKPRPR